MDATHALGRPRTYDLSAAGIAAGLSVIELARLVAMRGSTHGLTPLASLLGGGGFVLVLALAAVGLGLHRQLGWGAGVIGAVVAMGHGVVMRAGGNLIGIFYMVGGAALLALMIKSLHWYRSEQMAELAVMVPARQRAHFAAPRPMRGYRSASVEGFGGP